MPGGHKPKIQRHSGLSNTLPPGSLVWAYLRHSPGEEQTVVSQRRDVEEYVRGHQLVVAQWYVDEALSGGTGIVETRAAFERMLADSRRQPPPVAGVLIWDLSRFSRDLLEPQFYLADLRLRGYRVISIHDDLPDGEFTTIFESMIIWKNHRYLLDLSANVRRGHDAAVYATVEVDGKTITGFSAGGPAPVGYQAARIQVGTKPSGRPLERVYWVKTEDVDLRSRVERAWQMALEYARAGQMIEIGRIHEACHIHTNLSTYYHFFRSPTYKGTRHVGERLVDGAHEGYVTSQGRDLVQRFVSRGRPSLKVRHPRRANSPFYLSGGWSVATAASAWTTRG